MTTSPAYDAMVARKLRELGAVTFIPVTADTGPATIPSGPGKITEHPEPKRKGGWPKGKKRKAGK